MHVQINQAGRNNFTGGIEAFDFLGCLGGKIFADGGNFPVENQNICNGVEMIGGVNDAPAGEEQRIHAASVAMAD